MKTRLNAYTKYFGILYKRLKVSSDWRRAFKHEKSMIGYLNRLPILLLGKSGRTWILGLLAFARFALRMLRNSGSKGLAIYLKTCHTLLVKSVAGSPIKGVASSLGHRVAVTSGGLPTMIPSVHRKAIRRGDTNVIRFWSSLFSIYRVLDYFGRPKISTITSPGKSFKMKKYADFIPVFFAWLAPRDISFNVPRAQLVLITKSGPGVVSQHIKAFGGKFRPANSTSALIYQAAALAEDRFAELRKALISLAKLTGQRSLAMTLQDVIRMFPKAYPSGSSLVPSHLGKLGVKEEPGKVRVFAMVDYWTQMILRPIHLMIQDILKRIPSDSTFDQDAGVERGKRIFQRTSFAASYDLSAATDRLPVILQEKIIDFMIPGAGPIWKFILVGREYRVPDSIRKIGMKIPASITYAVGQPMGALSSWVMLALTHHFIVQFAAYNVGCKGWFSDYLILGDDIVIFNRDVASQYLKIMCDLGVEINLVKSVVSTTSFEFAKRFIHQNQNLSPVSFKEMDVASHNLDSLIMLYKRFLGEDWKLSSIAKFSGAGYRVLSKIGSSLDEMSLFWANLVRYCSIPGTFNKSAPDWLSWLSLSQIGKWNPSGLHLQSLKDKTLLWLISLLPKRINDPWSWNLRRTGWGYKTPTPFRDGWLLSRSPNEAEDRLISAVDRFLDPISLNKDKAKREIDKSWSDLRTQFGIWNDLDQATTAFNSMFELIDDIGSKESTVDLWTYRPELTPKSSAPRLLRFWHRLNLR
jgi:hypothetical protein